MLVTSILSFSHNVFKRLFLSNFKGRRCKDGLMTLKRRFLKTVWEKEKMLVTCTCIFSFQSLPHNPDFLGPRVKKKNLWKTLREKEKMLVTSIFSFSHNVFNPIRDKKENIAGKGENAGNQHFLLFPQCFQSYQRQKALFYLILFCRLQVL